MISAGLAISFALFAISHAREHLTRHRGTAIPIGCRAGKAAKWNKTQGTVTLVIGLVLFSRPYPNHSPMHSAYFYGQSQAALKHWFYCSRYGVVLPLSFGAIREDPKGGVCVLPASGERNRRTACFLDEGRRFALAGCNQPQLVRLPSLRRAIPGRAEL